MGSFRGISMSATNTLKDQIEAIVGYCHENGNTLPARRGMTRGMTSFALAMK